MNIIMSVRQCSEGNQRALFNKDWTATLARMSGGRRLYDKEPARQRPDTEDSREENAWYLREGSRNQ